jgi:hypothetical protein
MSLWVCPTHGLHHGPFCCDQKQEFWDGTFETENDDMDNNSSGIHPAPTEFSNMQIATDPILHFFHYAHLPPKLQATSRLFFILAAELVTKLPRNAERTVALRKLLEAKDAAVRANIEMPGRPIGQDKAALMASDQTLGEAVEIGGHDEDRDGPIPFGG